jgi:integrase
MERFIPESHPARTSSRGGSVSACSFKYATISTSTYNHRLAIISSLFEYAKRMRLYRGDNPIDAVSRRKLKNQLGA